MLLPVLSLALFPSSVSADCWTDFRDIPDILPYCCATEDLIPSEYVATCSAWNDTDICSPANYRDHLGCFYYCLGSDDDLPFGDCEAVRADRNTNFSAAACRWMLSGSSRNPYMLGQCRAANDQCPNEFCPLYSFADCWEAARYQGAQEASAKGKCCGQWSMVNASLLYLAQCQPLTECDGWSGGPDDWCHGYCVGGRHGEIGWCRDLIHERCEVDDFGDCCGEYRWLTGSDHPDCEVNATDCEDPALGDVDFCAAYCQYNADQNWSYCPEWRFQGCAGRAANLSDFGACCGRFPTFSERYNDTCAPNISACAEARWSSPWCSGYCLYVNEPWCDDPHRTRTVTFSRSLPVTPTASHTPTASPSSTISKTPSVTQSPPPTPTRSRTPTASPSGTISKTPSLTQSPPPTPTASRTPTASPSSTISKTPSLTQSPPPTPTRSRTPTASPSSTISKTPSLTQTPPPTATASRTPTASPSPHPTPTGTVSRTFPASPTASASPWPTPSLHPTPTPAQTRSWQFVDLSVGRPQALNSTDAHVVVRGEGVLTNDTAELVLSDVVFQEGTNCTATGLRMSGSIAMYGDAALRAEPGGSIAIGPWTDITFWPEVLGDRYAVPFLDLGTVGADFATRPHGFKVNLSAASIEEFAEVPTWSQPVVTAQTLNCEQWAEMVDLGNRSIFGTMCSPKPERRLSDADAAPASTLFVRGKAAAPAYRRATESILLDIVLFVLAGLVVAGTAVVFVIICKGPPPPEKPQGDIPADGAPELESLDASTTAL